MEDIPSIKKELPENMLESHKFTELEHIFLEKFSADVHHRASDFCNELFEKYGRAEVTKRQLFHILARSNQNDHKSCPYFDFDVIDEETGEVKHLIEDFIKSL
jgi:hypothetical protein